MINQRGFTLIELMIALALGLVVVAAATMLFITGVRGSQIQQGMSDLQESANFGLNYITQDIRLANLDAVEAELNDSLLAGGIVLSLNNLPEGVRSNIDDSLLSRGNGDTVGTDEQWTGASNVTQNSDQLVIQYKPIQVGGYDCEGRRITSTNMIIQRYFLREDENAGVGEGNPLALACDAGSYTDTTLSNFGDAGEIVMKRVDHFRVLLNVSNAAGNRRYIGIREYRALAGAKPRIIGVSLGVLTRSGQSIGRDMASQQTNAFTVLDQNNVTISSGGNPQGFIRQVLIQEVALRNALGERK